MGPGAGLHDPCEFLPTQDILWCGVISCHCLSAVPLTPFVPPRPVAVPAGLFPERYPCLPAAVQLSCGRPLRRGRAATAPRLPPGSAPALAVPRHRAAAPPGGCGGAGEEPPVAPLGESIAGGAKRAGEKESPGYPRPQHCGDEWRPPPGVSPRPSARSGAAVRAGGGLVFPPSPVPPVRRGAVTRPRVRAEARRHREALSEPR